MTRMRLPFTTLLITVALANFATLVVTYLLSVPVWWAVPIYLGCAVGGWLLARRIRWRRPAIKIDRTCVALAVLTLVLLTIPRLGYVTEWIPGNTVASIGDDYSRLFEIISMTLSKSYPLRHSCNSGYLLAYYYSGLYPFAVLKLLIPCMTLKDSLLVGYFFYHVLMLGSFVELTHLLMRNTVSARILMFLVTLFGGLDWMMAGSLMTDCEWWQARWFHASTQVTAFYTAQLIVIHHFLSFLSIMLAYAVFFYSRVAGGVRLKALIVLLLCASAFFASPYPVLSAPFLAIVHYRVILRRLVLSWAMPVVALAALVPLPLYCGRPPEQGFGFCTFRLALTGNYVVDRILGIPPFFLLVPLIEFGGIPFVLFFLFRRLGRTMRYYLLGSTAFFALTYVVADKTAGNLSWRGMFLPTFAMYAIFAYYFGRYGLTLIGAKYRRAAGVAFKLIAAAGIIGLLQSFTLECGISLKYNSLAHRLVGRPSPAKLAVLERIGSRDIARNRSITELDYRPEYGDRLLLVNAEKLINGVAIEDMAMWERQRARKPVRWQFW
jgi:hypothetical protein